MVALLLTVATYGMLGGQDGIVDFDTSYENVVDQFVLARLERLGIEPHPAPTVELIRRMSLDLTGELPDPEDYAALEDETPRQIALHYMSTPKFAAFSRMLGADDLQYSNDTMFSTVPQLQTLATIVGDLYTGVIRYDEYVGMVMESKAFLSRFTSSADRCTAVLSKFLGFEPVTQYDYQLGNAFNAYELSNRSADNTDPDYHEYVWTGDCDRSTTNDVVEVCDFSMWGHSGATPAEVADMLAQLPAFAEHTADKVWARLIGSQIDVIAPELTVALGEFFVHSGFSLQELLLEIMTSAAYTQSSTYRSDDLVLEGP